ncbi:MAG: hypothetical protein BroJett038_34630 [Chloroflexota bacterium]|nr:MAG: hypothetical protein BroJett038_34630 [Chloroflexota bacterium]
MMTNPVYLGHWMHKDRVVVWNNHPPIVPEELFYRALNYLSPYTLEGEENPHYAPRLGRVHSTQKKIRIPPKAIYEGLIGSFHEGKWRNATVAWRKSIETYAYNCHYMDLADNQHLLWARHCEYFDKAITEMLHAKLRATFDPAVWEEVLASASEDFDAERRMLKHQLVTVQQKMQALLSNFNFVQSETLLKALEREYANHDQEKARLEGKIADLEQRAEQQDALIALAKQAEVVLATWDEMAIEAQQAVAQAFIARIIVDVPNRYGVAHVEICWRDNTSDTIEVAYRADGSTIWFTWEVEALTEMLKEGVDQVTMAAALPDRKWHAIRLKAYEIIGSRNFHMSPKPIRDEEKYGDYLMRLERDGEKANKTSGNRWRKDELEALGCLLDSGAAQLEIAAALPIRSWQAIRRKIVQLRGVGVEVPDSRHLEDADTIHIYLERHPSAAGTMPFLILTNSSRQTRC